MRRPPLGARLAPYEQRQRQQDHQTARTLDKGHGRMERRTLTSSTRLNQHLDRPHVSQVCRLERERTIDGQKSVEVARDHWGAIENGLRWIRDEDFGEDRSPIVAGHAPQNLAATRNAVLNCLRILEVDNFAAN